jgi:hypothetical protein
LVDTDLAVAITEYLRAQIEVERRERADHQRVNEHLLFSAYDEMDNCG